jgi:serine/threonine protein kinase
MLRNQSMDEIQIGGPGAQLLPGRVDANRRSVTQLRPIFHFDEVVGSGAFGVVVRARDEWNCPVAVKFTCEKEEVPALLQLAGTPGVLELQRFYTIDLPALRQSTRLFALVFPLAEKTLAQKLEENNFTRNFRWATRVTKQIFRAVANMHAMDWLHLDIKPQNILIRKDIGGSDIGDDYIILGDLGSAERIPTTSPTSGNAEDVPAEGTYCVTRYYRAPEVVLGCPYATSFDTWACAVVAFELATGSKGGSLFQAPTQVQLITSMVETLGVPPEAFLQEMQLAQSYFVQDRQTGCWDHPPLGTARVVRSRTNTNLHYYLKNEASTFQRPCLESERDCELGSAELPPDWEVRMYGLGKSKRPVYLRAGGGRPNEERLTRPVRRALKDRFDADLRAEKGFDRFFKVLEGIFVWQPEHRIGAQEAAELL